MLIVQIVLCACVYENNFSWTVTADFLLCVWYSRYSESLFKTWTETVDESLQHNLSLPLINRELDSQLISVNFSPQVVP